LRRKRSRRRKRKRRRSSKFKEKFVCSSLTSSFSSENSTEVVLSAANTPGRSKPPSNVLELDGDGEDVVLVSEGKGAADAKALAAKSSGRSVQRAKNSVGGDKKVDFTVVLASLTGAANQIAQTIAAGPAAGQAAAHTYATPAIAPLPAPVPVTPAAAVAAGGAHAISGLHVDVVLSSQNLVDSCADADITSPSFFFETCKVGDYNSVATKFGFTALEAETLTGLEDLAAMLIDVLSDMRQNGGDFLGRLNQRFGGAFGVLDAKKIERVLIGLLNSAPNVP
jgi:hypothetical protein